MTKEQVKEILLSIGKEIIYEDKKLIGIANDWGKQIFFEFDKDENLSNIY